MKKNKLDQNNKKSLAQKAKSLIKKDKISDAKVAEALKIVPNITNENVEEHRETILSSARKFIYPLQHSSHKFVRRSLLILSMVLVAFFVYLILALYLFQSTSGFIYAITEVIPFPVAKEGNSWISYNSYLFELRRDMHYYVTQQQSNFNTNDGKNQLNSLKQRAMNRVIQDSYISTLAKDNGISVSNKEVDDAVKLVRFQNQLGNNNQVLDKVLSEYWGWDQSDLRRELRAELLSEKVVAKLDSSTNDKANNILTQLSQGGNFANLAKQYSEDQSTASNGGQYANSISPTDSNIDPRIVTEIFSLSPNQYSGLINTGYSLEIVQLNSISGDLAKVSHIQLNLQSINKFIDPYLNAHQANIFISVKTK